MPMFVVSIVFPLPPFGDSTTITRPFCSGGLLWTARISALRSAAASSAGTKSVSIASGSTMSRIPDRAASRQSSLLDFLNSTTPTSGWYRSR